MVLPFKPYVERGGVNNRPLIDVQSFQSTSRHHADQLEAFVSAVHNRYLVWLKIDLNTHFKRLQTRLVVDRALPVRG